MGNIHQVEGTILVEEGVQGCGQVRGDLCDLSDGLQHGLAMVGNQEGEDL